jgi:hypothetical protein
MGYGPALVLMRAETLVLWVENTRTKETREEIMSKSNGQLRTKVFEGDTGKSLMVGDLTHLAFESRSVNKVRKFGFCGFVDAEENILKSFQEMARLGTLPPTKVDAARPLV